MTFDDYGDGHDSTEAKNYHMKIKITKGRN